MIYFYRGCEVLLILDLLKFTATVLRRGIMLISLVRARSIALTVRRHLDWLHCPKPTPRQRESPGIV